MLLLGSVRALPVIVMFRRVFGFPRLPLWLGAPRSSRSYATYRTFKNAPRYDINYFRNLIYNRKFVYGVGAAGCVYLYNLHEAPFTQRLRFMWVPFWIAQRVGDLSYMQLHSEYEHQLLSPQAHEHVRISRVFNRLLETAIKNTPDEEQRQRLKNLPWSIEVIVDDPATNKVNPPNAFILSNGKVFVFASILSLCENDNGLATVLSHELSHQLASHIQEQLSKSPIFAMLSVVIAYNTKSSLLSRILVNGFLKMPSSRSMETEADRIGCELMARSCYDVREATKFWSRMRKWEESQMRDSMLGSGWFTSTRDFFSTHPSSDKRIHDIISWMPHLEALKESSGCYDHQIQLFGDFGKSYGL